MRITLCGTRGSVGRAGPGTVRYGGDTSAVKVENVDGATLILDAGSGIARVEMVGTTRVDILLTHLHMDHIQGLGFFQPLFDPEIETHIWGPASTAAGLGERLGRYLSPPLFPVRLRDLPSLRLHDVFPGSLDIPGFQVTADVIIHPGTTLGYRLGSNGDAVAYLPDHEPALGWPSMSPSQRWLSGHQLAEGVDVLIHDAQYTDTEYQTRIGWGHSSYSHCLALGEAAGVGRLVTFHHDPEHGDEQLDRLHEEAADRRLDFELVPGVAGAVFEV